MFKKQPLSNFDNSKSLYKKTKFSLQYKVCFYNLGFNFKLHPDFIYSHSHLLVYCYYINKHKDINDIHQILAPKNRTKLSKLHSSINPITASILSPSKNIGQIRNFINILLSHGFEFTNNDLIIANMRLYKSIKNKVKKNIILLLINDILPLEINTVIIDKLLYNLRYDNYVLPY